MYEFHGWFGIAESPEESDTGSLDSGIAELGEEIRDINWATGEVALNTHNGEFFVIANGLMNRRRDEAAELD
ncbi:Imm7 family immunity protein [Streptomyces bacillaris]|uniref:Imm7 family immunity protein n=1 Tax=Streptomyces bacillaris TaxID=68179 RepID=UPI003460BC19